MNNDPEVQVRDADRADLSRISIAGGLSSRQRTVIFILAMAIAIGLVISWVHTIAAILTIVITLFALNFIVTLRLMQKAQDGEVEIPPLLSDEACVLYTILIPVRKEIALIPQIIESMTGLDYPVDKMDIILIADEDDQAMCEVLQQTLFPSPMRYLIVPELWKGSPEKPVYAREWVGVKSKPRSLNYAAYHGQIRGEFVVIFDAEDHPEPDQLRKAATVFRAHPDITCLQAELRWWNAFQKTSGIPNLFTRGVAAGYAYHFGLKLAGLAQSRGVFPLGGTSNHLRTTALRAVGYWDAYNVTEDLDLGVKLSRAGFTSMVLPSVTYEEATSGFKAQVKQNSRWIKGHTATFVAHTRDPISLFQDLGMWGSLTFITCVAFSHPAVLCAPLFWAGMILYALTRADVIEQIIPAYTFYLGTLCFLGNGVYLWLTMLSAMKTKQPGLIPWILLLPLYWASVLVTSAALAFREILRGDWYLWHKTAHVLTRFAEVPRIVEREEISLPDASAPVSNLRDFSEYRKRREPAISYMKNKGG